MTGRAVPMDRPVTSGPLVFVIVLNWNGWRDTVECLSALQHLDRARYRVLVVDNGSSDDSEQRIRQAYPDVALIQTGANLGYAGGNNVGIRSALREGAAYVVLLNPDVVVEPLTLDVLVGTAQSYPEIGALSPVVRYKDKPQQIWFGNSLIDWRAGRAIQEEIVLPPAPYHPVAWASGCCLLLRAAALRAVGLFDVRYFLYSEETDLCERLRGAGYAVGVCPDTSGYHQASSAVGADSPKLVYYMTRNALLFFLRHASRHDIPRGRLAWMLYRRYVLNRDAARAILRRDPAAIARLHACVDAGLGHFGPSRHYNR